MGMFANWLGKIWVKHLFNDPTPRYGENGNQSFGRYIAEANTKIEGNKKKINDACQEIAELLHEDDLFTRFQVVKKECHGNSQEAWHVWWNIRYIEATCGVQRQIAHDTVRDMIRQGKPLKSEDECQEKINEMIARGEETVHV